MHSLKLRPEQEAAVVKTFNYWRSLTPPHIFLWNAKPRFGKTIAAYEFARRIEAKRILIITNRPAVSDSWEQDFSFLNDESSEDFIFATARSKIMRDDKLLKRPLVFFISLQDIKGRVPDSENLKTKNRWIFEIKEPWDLVIIDESHEGVKTSRSQNILSTLPAKFTLYLSGTPFRALQGADFSDAQIFNWTYLDEQKSWQSYHQNPQQNPQQTSTPPRLEFYLEASKPIDFKNHLEVTRFLEQLKTFYRQKSNAFYLRHTFWFLPGVAECRALEKVLNSDPFFKNFTTILAAGKTENYHSGQRIIDRVRSAISEKQKTITISCGQLSTGVTIPEWSGIFMLGPTADLSRLSVTQYLQTVFRAQTPYHNKTAAIVYDIYPERALSVLESYASKLCDDNGLWDYVDIFLDDHKINYEEAHTLIRHITISSIVDGGFVTSDELFNLHSLYNLNDDTRKILAKIPAFHKGYIAKNFNHKLETKSKFKNKKLIVDREILNSSSEIIPYDNYSNRVKQKIKNLAAIEFAIDESVEDKIETGEFSPEEILAISDALTTIREQARRNARLRFSDEISRFRDQIRGLARYIPALLYLYNGNSDNIIEIINSFSDHTIKDFCGISRVECQTIFESNIFNMENFRAAIREFQHRVKDSNNYNNFNPDQYIFNYMAPQLGENIFTPLRTAQNLINLLERQNRNIFKSRERTFFDPAAKSGTFLRLITERLFLYERPHFKTDHDCLKSILNHQIFACSPSPEMRDITLKTLIGDQDFTDAELREIGENFQVLDFTNPLTVLKIQEQFMKFDVIIGNPPYKKGRRQIYADFYKLAVDLDPELLCMVFPQGWQKPYNHNGLAVLNQPQYKADKHLVLIDNYDDAAAKNLFPELSTGGINIVLRDRNYNNHGKIEFLKNGSPDGAHELALSRETLHRPKILLDLVPKFENLPNISTLGSGRDPYGLPASALRHPEKFNLTSDFLPLRLYGLLSNKTRGFKYLSADQLPKSTKCLSHYKLFVPKAWGNMSDSIGLGGAYANIAVARPDDICTETFIEFGPFRSRSEAVKMGKYFLTQFFRALLYLAKDSQNTARDKYRFIPVPDLSDPIWNQDITEINEYLFELYELPASTREFIRKNIQKRDASNLEIL